VTPFVMQGLDYRTGKGIELTIADGQIARIERLVGQDSIPDWPIIAPGLFDLQINGYGGQWFSDPRLTPASVLEILRAYLRHGVTRLYPTLITNSVEAICTGLAAIRAATEQAAWAKCMVAGCHVEGPFISEIDGPRGAHPRQHVRPPSLQEYRQWQVASGGLVKLVTLAPEVPGAVDFTRAVCAEGVTVAIGHSQATRDEINAVVAAGARFSTHLGNGCASTIHRHHNVLWPQLDATGLTAGVISDGFHLPPEMLRVIAAVKGPSQLVITCDASGWAGCAAGRYENESLSVELLPNGKLVLAGQTELLAGSAQTTEVCVARFQQMTGLPMADCWDMASLNPARLLGCPEYSLTVGSRADVTCFNWNDATANIEVAATYLAGELVYRSV
jgi:N-acetylglucosamine-6-phosphate deacetylase